VEAAAVDIGRRRAELPEPGFTDSILSLFFPPRCVHCGAPGGWLCPACAGLLAPVGPCCRRCGSPQAAFCRDCPECRGKMLGFGSATAAFCFQGPARSLVHALKYRRQRRLAAFMAALPQDHPACLTAAGTGVTLTYVPLHRSKLISRGYNQAELYARAISRRWRLPVKDLLLKRIPTPAQNRLGLEERGRNLAGSFGLQRMTGAVTGRVILVDDVFTTGSTATACARVLRERLDVEVDVWTFARTVKAGV
jgi:ComF family protein